jgi:hypothetical protein
MSGDIHACSVILLMLHHFYEPLPIVEHFESLMRSDRQCQVLAGRSTRSVRWPSAIRRPRQMPKAAALMGGRDGVRPTDSLETVFRIESELGTFLFTAERFDHDHVALAVLLGLNSLRVSKVARRTSKISDSVEVTGRFGSLAREQAGGDSDRAANSPTIDLAIGDCTSGPILRRRDGVRLHRRTAHRWGSSNRKAGRSWGRTPPQAEDWLHHGRARRQRPTQRRPDRSPTCRPEDDHIDDRRRENFDRHASYGS